MPAPEVKPVSYDGPFGLKMGLTVTEAQAAIPTLEVSEDFPGTYESSSVPVPHRDFESYMFNFSEVSGLCRVVAIGKDIQSGRSGYEVRSAFDALDSAITEKYGKGKLYDFATSSYDSPEFWMMHLLQKDRTFAKVWSTDTGSNLRSNISAIELQANASDMSTGYLVIRYEFQNMQDCVAESEAEKNKGL